MVVAVGSWTLFASHTGYIVDLPTVVMAVIGGLMPDIDHPRSTINRFFLPFKIIARSIPHRGPTHSLLILGILTWFLYGSLDVVESRYKGWVFAFWCGYTSHIVADWMTLGGVPLLWPYKRRSKMPLAFPTGGYTERGVVMVIILAMSFYFIGINPIELTRDFLHAQGYV